MNRLCYRVIFSKTLNKLIVVSEKTSAQVHPNKSQTLSNVAKNSIPFIKTIVHYV